MGFIRDSNGCDFALRNGSEWIMNIDNINSYLNIQNSLVDSDEYMKHLINKTDMITVESRFRDYENVIDIGCGNGFITKSLSGKHVTGIDISDTFIINAQGHHKENLEFTKLSLFDLMNNKDSTKYDLVLLSEILYEPYIGDSANIIYKIIDYILKENGIVITCHADNFYRMRFPYLLKNQVYFESANNSYKLEVYIK